VSNASDQPSSLTHVFHSGKTLQLQISFLMH